MRDKSKCNDCQMHLAHIICEGCDIHQKCRTYNKLDPPKKKVGQLRPKKKYIMGFKN